MGVDFASYEELIFNESNRDYEILKAKIGHVDSLRYISHKNLIEAIVGKENVEGIKTDSDFYEKTKHCGACFTGKYPLQIKGTFIKN